jgi:hypothetical protein
MARTHRERHEAGEPIRLPLLLPPGRLIVSFSFCLRSTALKRSPIYQLQLVASQPCVRGLCNRRSGARVLSSVCAACVQYPPHCYFSLPAAMSFKRYGKDMRALMPFGRNLVLLIGRCRCEIVSYLTRNLLAACVLRTSYVVCRTPYFCQQIRPSPQSCTAQHYMTAPPEKKMNVFGFCKEKRAREIKCTPYR